MDRKISKISKIDVLVAMDIYEEDFDESVQKQINNKHKDEDDMFFNSIEIIKPIEKQK